MRTRPYPPIADYALIGDCHSAALVSRTGSIDWCCLPRFDSDSIFGRLLDWKRGGFCAVEPSDDEAETSRAYVDETLVLATTVRTGEGEARILDCFGAPPAGERSDERRKLLRIVEGVRGTTSLEVAVVPRFDYGAVDPFLRDQGGGAFTATGGDDGLLVWSDARLTLDVEGASLASSFEVESGERLRLYLEYVRPENIDDGDWEAPDAAGLDRVLEETLHWWREWAGTLDVEGPDAAGALRSALVLRAFSYEPTGALVAAPTTSLPESAEPGRTWDYRFSWIRDSVLSARSLARLGFEAETDAFRRFVERTAAGDPAGLRIVYGLGGEESLPEEVVDGLEGYRGRGPVRVGNAAVGQNQHDAFGQLLEQSWRWHQRGNAPDEEYWTFLRGLADAAVERWELPDSGIWEWPGEPRHFVHSKTFCWAALDRALRLSEDCGLPAPSERWAKTRDEIRGAIEEHGWNAKRGTFVQAFGHEDLDAAALRLPTVGFLDWSDERMIATADTIREELSWGGLIRRYDADDGLPGREGTFLACSFWLVEVLARQNRVREARELFDRAVNTANDVGLFSEEYDPEAREMRGNFPQALTHMAHIEALLALSDA